MNFDAILTNPCGRTGEIVARSLRRRGLSVYMMEGPSAHKMPRAYLSALHKVVDENGGGTVIPVFFPEVLAASREDFPGAHIPLDSADNILRLDNKISACSLAASLGIRQPRIYASIEEVDEYPVVFKRPFGLGSDSVYFPRTEKALRNIARTAPEYMLTGYVRGEDLSVDAVRWDGYFYAASYRVLERKLKGVSRRRVSVRAPEAEECVRRILDAVGYRGVCGVDFRLGDDGSLYFLECNPRFSGGLESAVESGFDIPWIFWQLSHGMQPDEVVFREGVVTGEG